MLVKNKKSGEPNVIMSQKGIANKFDKIISTISNSPLRLYAERNRGIFYPEWWPDSLAAKVEKNQPDIINLHWVCGGYMQVESVPKFNKPLVWALHDMWPFTGGCHYSEECARYTQSCGGCPQLHSNLVYLLRKRRADLYNEVDAIMIGPK